MRVSLLLFLSGSALMAGPMGRLPAICPGIVLRMPSLDISVEVTIRVHVCVCVFFPLFSQYIVTKNRLQFTLFLILIFH